MTDSFPVFVTCLPGLEPFLLQELESLEFSAQAVPGGAEFEGSTADVMRACLWLGTASQVLIPLAQFRCRALGELERKAMEVPWRDWLMGRVPISLSSRSRRSRVYHTGGISERIYNAIGHAFGQTPLLAKDNDDMVARVVTRFSEDTCTIAVDATSTPLHRRGYRLDGRKAPLREDIAHALVLASNWDRDTAVLDPFCGSGTIAIEAAGLALGLPPGRMRDPAFQQSPRFDIDAWQKLTAPQPPRAFAASIFASDRDKGAVSAARANAERAGVDEIVEVAQHALAAQPWLEGAGAPSSGAIITNPPFGVRVSKGNSLLPLYQKLGHRTKALGDGWDTTILAHDMRLARRTGLHLKPRFTTRHGGMKVTAMGSLTADEIAARHADKTDNDGES